VNTVNRLKAQVLGYGLTWLTVELTYLILFLLLFCFRFGRWVFCLHMASQKWLQCVKNHSFLPLTSGEEVEQNENSAAFAIKVTSIEGSNKIVSIFNMSYPVGL